MKITKENILSDFKKLVSLSERLFARKKYEQCVSAIRTAALLMYNFNLIYSEERLEKLLHGLSDVYLPNFSSATELNEKTVLFYDWWILETRGLSTIYIKGLLKNGYKVIVATLESNRSRCAWLNDLLGDDGVIEFFDTKKSSKEQLGVLARIYKKYLPASAFFHSMPDDVVVCAFFAKLSCKRYLINLTDHAFWLGASCMDYCIEFRDYGYTISKNHRQIPEKKLLVLPYYPVHKTVKADAMADFFEAHQNIVFSGGSLYKIAGSPEFFEIVSYILDTYKDSTFVFIGGGNAEFVKRFISQKGYEQRFFYFEERPDFEDFIRHSKFFLCTYPIMGALMNQLAVVNRKIPLCYNPNMDDIARDGDNESLFIDTGHNPAMSYKTLDELKKEIDKFFTDETYLKQQEEKLSGMLLSEDEFNDELKSLLEFQKTKFIGKECKVDLEEFAQIYIDAENNTNHNYDLLFARSKSLAVYKYFPFLSFYGIMKILRGKLYAKRK